MFNSDNNSEMFGLPQTRSPAYISQSCGAYSVTTVSSVEVTNLTLPNVYLSGDYPIIGELIPEGLSSGNTGTVRVNVGGVGSASVTLELFRNGVSVAAQLAALDASSGNILQIPPSSFKWVDWKPLRGNTNYSVRVTVGGGGASLNLSRVRLMVYEAPWLTIMNNPS